MKYLLFLIAIVTCHTEIVYTQNASNIHQIIESVKKQYAPDGRTIIFSVKASENENEKIPVLSGKIMGENIHQILLSKLKAANISVQDSIQILPRKSFGKDTLGLVNISVANLRVKPSYSEEMSTQILLGTPVKLLDQEKNWRHIQTPDGYVGWVQQFSITPIDKDVLNDWKSTNKIIYTSLFGLSYLEPDEENSQSVSDLVCGDILICTDNTNPEFYNVVYPDGRTAFVAKKEAMPYEEWLKSRDLTPENIVKTAKKFMGIPYFWGGTSAKGMDCSGFTKIVYFLNGVILTRDASQQIHSGTLVETQHGFENLQPGDLIFFGNKATKEKKEQVIHVAISLGGTEFLHASGMIRQSSFDPKSPLYDEFNTNRILRVKRIIGSVDGKNDWWISQHPLYKKQRIVNLSIFI